MACAPEKPGSNPATEADTDTAPACSAGLPTDTDIPTEPTMTTGEEPLVCGRLDWVVHISSFSVDEVAGVELAPDGTVVLAGWYAHDLTFERGSAEPYVLPEHCYGPSDEMFLSKHALDGSVVWATRVGGCDHVRAKTFAVRADGDIVVAGTISGAATFGIGEPGETAVETEGMFVARYRTDGTFRWVVSIGTGGIGEDPNDIALGSDGSIYVTGEFEKDIVFAAGTAQELVLAGSPPDGSDIYRNDLFTAAYTEDGAFRWAQVAGTTPALDAGHGVVAIGGEVFVSADLGNPTTLGVGTPQEVTLAPTGAYDAPLLTYDAANGAFLYAEVLAGGRGFDLEGGTDSYLTAGAINSPPAVFGAGSPGEVVVDVQTYYLARYGTDGELRHLSAPTGAPLGATNNPVTVTETSSIAVAGYFSEYLDFDGGVSTGGASIVAQGSMDAFVATYDYSGNFSCAWSLGGIERDEAAGAVADSGGGVIATGTFRGTLVIEDGKPERTELASDKGSTDIFLVRYK